MKNHQFKILAFGLVFAVTGITARAQSCSGCLDPTFGDGGEFILSSANANPEGMALQTDNKIVALFRENDSATPELGYLMRFTSDGVPDNSFGYGGVVTLNWGGNSGRVLALSLQTIGGQQRIIVGGWESCGPNKQCLRAEAYDANGSLDATFASGG